MPRVTPVPQPRAYVVHKAQPEPHPAQPRIPDMLGCSTGACAGACDPVQGRGDVGTLWWVQGCTLWAGCIKKKTQNREAHFGISELIWMSVGLSACRPGWALGATLGSKISPGIVPRLPQPVLRAQSPSLARSTAQCDAVSPSAQASARHQTGPG
eukprot:scaffold7717_cov117-Isochrysis_galbana.AAC.2